MNLLDKNLAKVGRKKNAPPKPEPKAKKTEAKDNGKDKKAADKSKAAKSGPNTKTQPYIDKFNTATECADDKKRIEEKCAPEPEQSEEEKKAGPPKKKGVMGVVSKASHALDKIGRAGYTRNDKNAWMDTHCDFMWIKPMNVNALGEDFNTGMTSALEKLKSDKWTLVKGTLSDLGDKAVEKAGAAAKKKLWGLAARAAAKNIVGGAAVVGTLGTVGDVVEVGMLAWTASDILSTASELAKMAGEEGIELLENVKNSINIKDKIDEVLDDFKKNPDKALADSMEVAGKMNKCVRAKRCQLVPMNRTGSTEAKRTGEGCCPGQTGHHLLPEEMFKRKVQVPTGELTAKKTPKMKYVDDKTNCPEYTRAKHANAPVVCVEGTNQNTATHKKIHDNFDALMKDHRGLNGDQIKNDQAIAAAAKSHKETFKTGCNEHCIIAQLTAYYNDLCKDQMKPRGGTGKDIEPGVELPADAPII